MDGQDIYDEGYDMKALRSKVGLVFQYPDHQLFETTCFEDVCFGPKNQGLDRRDVELRAFEALRNVGFPEELFYQPAVDLFRRTEAPCGNRRSTCNETGCADSGRADSRT